MSPDLWAEEAYRQAQALVDDARRAGLMVGLAESCTGGLASGFITAIPGSSDVLRGSIVSYALEVKHRLLGVDSAILDDPAVGAVSEACAVQMALGALSSLNCDIATSVTGIAGPGGAEPGKPVGTVCFGLATAASQRAHTAHFAGTRDEVRLQAVIHVLTLLREGIAELTSGSS